MKNLFSMPSSHRSTFHFFLIFLSFVLLCNLWLPAAASARLTSDDFSSSNLDAGLWRIHDPLNDAIIGLVGSGTADARLSIFLPAGPSHDPWTTDTATRILQSVADTDFSVELKFDSPLTQTYQGQGLMVQQDDNTWLRFDLFSNGGSVYVFSASKAAGAMSVKVHSPTPLSGFPVYLKVERNGSLWTQSYSADGINWTVAGSFNHAIAVTEMGPFAGNFDSAGNAPAHTALVDYFFDTGNPIVPEDSGSAVQNWSVATNVSGNGSVTLSPANGPYPDGSTVSVTAVADAGWVFSGWSGDLVGSVNPESLVVDSSKSVTAIFAPQLTVPSISNIQVTPQATGAILTWTTDVPSTSRVDYGQTTGYGSYVEDLTLVTSHSLQLNGLSPDTTYHYRLSSGNSAGTSQTTTDLTFTTPVQNWAVTTSVSGNGSVTLSPANGPYPDGSTVTVAAAAEAGWVFSGWSGDLGGSLNPESLLIDSSKSIIATFVLEPTAPNISNVQVVSDTSSATITWSTDVPSSSRVEYGETAAYGTVVEDFSEVTGHSVVLTGLAPGVVYHYQISSANSVGFDQSADLMFTTPTSVSPVGLTSDDFSVPNLRNDLWTLVDPLAGATVVIEGAGSGDSRLSLSIEGGQSHDPWNVNNTARLMQSVPDEDFHIEIKFDSTLTKRYQEQGLLVEQDDNNWLRFDFYSDGVDTHVFSAVKNAGEMSTKINSIISNSSQYYLRVMRTGDVWTQSYSYDGVNWVQAGKYSQVLTVNSVGPFVGNYDSANNAPAHTAVIDYIFNVQSPVTPEDSVSYTDSQPPFIHKLAEDVGVESVQLTWFTDEVASSTVEYGLTTELELGEVNSAQISSSHSAVISGLISGAEYFYRVKCSDSAGNTSTSAINSFVTASVTGDTPIINVWYGNSQTFGAIGMAQDWVNILGSVSSSNSIDMLAYSLNGEPEITLGVGPDGRRLQNEGDFNIDIALTDMQLGTNDVAIRARDSLGRETVKNVEVTYVGGNTWPLDFTVDWTNVSSVQSTTQVVDGRWYIDGNKLRTQEPGYDRLVAIGDIGWQNYEVTVPVVVHSLKTDYVWPPIVGMILRWQGHVANGYQPNHQWYPLGAIGAYSFGEHRVELWGDNPYVYDYSFNMSLNTAYVMKMRVESLADRHRYSFKIWAEDQAEPSGWNVVGEEGLTDLSSGSLVLLAHEADVSFGAVSVVKLP
jgi:regulation of enolase protein 1 (concanavalin A-like superfamily)